MSQRTRRAAGTERGAGPAPIFGGRIGVTFSAFAWLSFPFSAGYPAATISDRGGRERSGAALNREGITNEGGGLGACDAVKRARGSVTVPANPIRNLRLQSHHIPQRSAAGKFRKTRQRAHTTQKNTPP